MGQNTKIEWTHHSWNPWWGCFKVSPGCSHCYAETLSKRFRHAIWGPAKTTSRRLFGDAHWAEPLKWNRDAAQAGERRRVFCASMADVFEDHPQLIEPRARLIQLIRDTPMLDWLLLSKRPEGWGDRLHEVVRHTHDGADMLASQWLDGDAPANVWMGTSVEDQQRADERIPQLLQVPARVRFLSCEPLLGPVDLLRTPRPGNTHDYLTGEREYARGRETTGRIHWVIAGGESGHGARPMHPSWARSLRDQCQAAGVAFFMKQWGEWEPVTSRGIHPDELMRNRWIVRDGCDFLRVGKHAAGRLLDGRTWDELPEVVSYGV